MKLTLADDDGVVLGVYTIGTEKEYDVEDLEAVPEHQLYTEDGDRMDFSDVCHDILVSMKQEKNKGE